jgi:hypothetical protein
VAAGSSRRGLAWARPWQCAHRRVGCWERAAGASGVEGRRDEWLLAARRAGAGAAGPGGGSWERQAAVPGVARHKCGGGRARRRTREGGRAAGGQRWEGEGAGGGWEGNRSAVAGG